MRNKYLSFLRCNSFAVVCVATSLLALSLPATGSTAPPPTTGNLDEPTPGEFEAVFKDSGTKPENTIAEVTSGEAATVNGVHTQNQPTTGYLRVCIEPYAAHVDGARWRIDGSDWITGGG